MTANGAIAALVAITAPSGYVEFWAAPIIGFVAGVIVVGAIVVDRPQAGRPSRRALGARHRRRLGHALVRALHRTAPRGAERDRRRRAVLHGLVPPAGHPGARRGRRVHLGVRGSATSSSSRSRRPTASASSHEEERYGLDIVEHGMWGYPEQFMPVPGSEYRPPAMPKGWPPASRRRSPQWPPESRRARAP